MSRKIRKMVSPEGDPQRAQIYELEDEMRGSMVYHHAPLHYLKKIAHRACRLYGVDPVKITSLPASRREYWAADYGDGELALGSAKRGGRCLATVLHEVSHHIVDELWEDVEDHGKEFAGVLMHLFDKFQILPQDAFRVMARRWKVRISNEAGPGRR